MFLKYQIFGGYRTMTFKRGQEAKKSMNIGLTADAIKIEGISEFIMQANGKEYVPIKDEKRVIAILRQLQLNKYNSDPNDIRFLKYMLSVNMWGKGKKELTAIGINPSYTKELVVEYKEKFYVIPIQPRLWSRWQDVQYTTHLFKNSPLIKA